MSHVYFWRKIWPTIWFQIAVRFQWCFRYSRINLSTTARKNTSIILSLIWVFGPNGETFKTNFGSSTPSNWRTLFWEPFPKGLSCLPKKFTNLCLSFLLINLDVVHHWLLKLFFNVFTEKFTIPSRSLSKKSTALFSTTFYFPWKRTLKTVHRMFWKNFVFGNSKHQNMRSDIIIITFFR